MKKILSALVLFFVTSCASTHGNFISEHKDAWIDGYSAKSNRADRGLLFCRANAKDDGLADPVCYETRFEEYADEKDRVNETKKKEEKLKKKESQAASNKDAKDSQ
jgi:hypothetical protein